MCIACFQAGLSIVHQATRVVQHLTHPGDEESDDSDNRKLDCFV